LLRIAFLEGSPSLRARYVLPILTKRFRITYITSGDDIPPGDYEEVIRFPKAKVFFQNSFAYARIVERLYKDGKIDLAYNYHAVGCFIRRAPQLAFFGGSFGEEFKLRLDVAPWYAWYARTRLAVGFVHYVVPEIMTCRRAKRIVANSDALRQQLIAIHKLDDSRTAVVRNGVAREAMAIFQHKDLRNTTDLLFVGRLHWRKGIVPLLEAFQRRPGISANFYIVGEGPQWGEVSKIAAADKRIIVLGSQEQSKVFELMATTKYFLWPSLHEGFPNAFAEAMASGHVCIFYDIPANVELAGGTGICVQSGKPDLILDALEQALKKQDESNEMAVAANKRVSIFTWEACADDLESELTKCASRLR
jgi:glycosyltransferase involved in cell wall biosynthesis